MPLTNNLITRFPNGVTNLPVGNIFNDLKIPDPTLYHTFFDDFDRFLASDWTIAETGTGTRALADGNGGLLLITNDANDNDNTILQNVNESFLLAAGKPLFFKTRFSLGDATQSDFLVGLSVRDVATPLAPTDGIYFLKADDAATVSVVCRKNTTTGSTTAVVGTLANATMVELAMFYDGVDRLYYALNGTIIGALDASSSFLPDTELLISIVLQNGAGAAKTATLDYIYCANTR